MIELMPLDTLPMMPVTEGVDVEAEANEEDGTLLKLSVPEVNELGS